MMYLKGALKLLIENTFCFDPKQTRIIFSQLTPHLNMAKVG